MLISRLLHHLPADEDWAKPEITFTGPPEKRTGVKGARYNQFHGRRNEYVSCFQTCPAIDSYLFEYDEETKEWILWLFQVLIEMQMFNSTVAQCLEAILGQVGRIHLKFYV